MSTMLQDLYMPRPRLVCTTARPVTCNACGRGVDAGHGIRALRTDSGDVMLCNLHYPKQ